MCVWCEAIKSGKHIIRMNLIFGCSDILIHISFSTSWWFSFFISGSCFFVALKPFEGKTSIFNKTYTDTQDDTIYECFIYFLYIRMICSTLNRFFFVLFVPQWGNAEKQNYEESKYVCNVEKSTFRNTCGHYYDHSRFDLNFNRVGE